MDKLRILYFGQDQGFSKKIEQRFKDDYEDLQVYFENKPLEKSQGPQAEFLYLYRNNFDIIYLDFSQDEKLCLNIAKLATRDNMTKLKGICALHPKKNFSSSISPALMAGIRINFIKCDEIHDLIYVPLSFLDPNFPKNPGYATFEGEEHSELLQDIRIGYINKEKYHVESNSPIPEGSCIDIFHHPLQHIFKDTLFEVRNKKEQGLYYNSRFGYDFHYFGTYHSLLKKSEDTPVFNERKQKKFSYESYYNDADNENDLESLAEGVKRSTKKIEEWLQEHENDNPPKITKILAIDRKLNILEQLKDRKEKDNLPFILNIQSHLGGNAYQIRRSLPHVIAYELEPPIEGREDSPDINGLISLEEILKTIKSIENYFPFLIIFNTPKSNLQEKIKTQYGFTKVLTSDKDLDISILISIASRADEENRKNADKHVGKVYFKTQDPKSLLTFKRPIDILSLTESILYFRSETPIPDWTVFKVEHPIKMLLTVVPHKDKGKFKKEPDVYRSLINGVGELEKIELRKTINLFIKKQKEEREEAQKNKDKA